VIDPRHGYFVNDLAGYHMPSHADNPTIEAVFLDKVDDEANPLKIKGVGNSASAVRARRWRTPSTTSAAY